MKVKTKEIKRINFPQENPFTLNEDFIIKSIGLKKTEYKDDVKIHFSDNYIYIEYELSKAPLPAGCYINTSL